MSGGLIQLVAYGAQDIHLTGNPTITFFKSVYRSHTNFAIESIQQVFNGTVNFGSKVSCIVSRNADLASKIYLQLKLPALDADNRTSSGSYIQYCNSVGHAIIDNVEFDIGGQKIDKHYAEWMEIWSELSTTEAHRAGVNEMLGRDGEIQTGDAVERQYYVPLIFYFNRYTGCSLPLIALQHHEVRLDIQFKSFSDLVQTNGTVAQGSTAMESTNLWVDYVYLDNDERRRFARQAHEYLIDQLQFPGSNSVTFPSSSSSSSSTIRMDLNHPCKGLYWVARLNDATTGAANKRWFDFSDGQGAQPSSAVGNIFNDPLKDAKITLNGSDRFAVRDANYFRLVQPFTTHTRIPDSFIYAYLFALHPEQHQPSGTLNFSRVDNASLKLTLKGIGSGEDGVVNVYSINYNVLRILNGMGGLAYAS